MEELARQFFYLGQSTEQSITLSVSIEKEVTRIDKNGQEIINIISLRLQFIDCVIFMASSLWSLVKNLAERTHKMKL